MTVIDKTAIVSCYADTAALLVMVILLLMTAHLRRQNNPSLQAFHKLCQILAITCVMSFICHAMIRQPASWCHIAAITSRTLWAWLSFMMIMLWVSYVEKKLDRSRNLFKLVNILYNLPFLFFTVLLVVNLFTGIIFTCTEDNQYEYTQLYYVFIVIEALYFVVSVIRVRFFNVRMSKVYFIRVTPLLLPIVLGTALQFFFPYQADILGFAVGALLLYSSMAQEIRCQDEESGMYNKNFLAYLCDLVLADRSKVHSALILETGGNLPAGYDILRDTLHQDGDVIRVEERKFVMYSAEQNRSAIGYLTSLLDEAINKHNKENPEEQVQITVRCRMRTANEDAFTFLRTVLEEKEAGDEMKSIVSMVSELDQLDKELKLAADIQINTLPMNFPAFPDRTEFDLYASMTPAKDVGGDFYDFFLIDNDHLALVIADVSGKGIPAALFMMVSKTLIKNQVMSGADPASALERVNLQLCEHNSSMMFVTVWLAVLEISTGRGMACNAGHEKPAVLSANEGFELLKYKHNMFIGVNKKAKYQNREFELHAGDGMFVYTDGVPEATDAAGGMFGEERLAATLNQEPDAEPKELIQRMHDAVDSFAGNAPQFDDITMLCLKYYGAEGSPVKTAGTEKKTTTE